ncbi:hypothetical protein BU24DRAFT_498037 [Aaosphaeria arxii CBS 175.79]|uniref:BTB domain-containing protein n=1 Tax=Aaosphaeria arxii CBS 175.79 TaxID=1450172 RepID=A0A6A5X5W4_9PLEO|nr:uncharacterized protein BU24DRAFT_498037 [Aaosphaeria arxii CBS 175.79]KAF2008343.1 hypothetical protein BU24DRAFT_498037 [Aaosphaeria arxii CBS 175.79]
MDQRKEYIVEERGDLEVIVGDSHFIVSSERLSSLSPTFARLCQEANSKTNANKILKIKEDPDAFLRIAQSAHGMFIPKDDISTDIMLSLTLALSKYQIPTSSTLYASISFAFVVQTLKPAKIPSEKVLILLKVALHLDLSKFKMLAADVFLHHPLCFKPIPCSNDDICGIVLANVLLRIADTRRLVVHSLLHVSSTVLDWDYTSMYKLHVTGLWILEANPSLEDIQAEIKRNQCTDHIYGGSDRAQAILESTLRIITSSTDQVQTFINNLLDDGSDQLRAEILEPEGEVNYMFQDFHIDEGPTQYSASWDGDSAVDVFDMGSSPASMIQTPKKIQHRNSI